MRADMYSPYKEIKMAFSPTESGFLNPGRFFTGCSGSVVVNGVTGVFIPHSSLESYKNATSGDVRELTYSILDAVVTGLNNLSTKSEKMVCNRSISFVNETTVRKTYNVSVDLNAANTTYDVKDET